MTLPALKPSLQMAMPAILPAAMAIDAKFGMAMALGMLGGWLARTGQSVQARKTWADIRRDLGVSLLISGGSLLATLYFARLLAADELGVATIGFAICWGGTDSLRLLRRFILAPILAAIKNQEPDT